MKTKIIKKNVQSNPLLEEKSETLDLPPQTASTTTTEPVKKLTKLLN